MNLKYLITLFGSVIILLLMSTSCKKKATFSWKKVRENCTGFCKKFKSICKAQWKAKKRKLNVKKCSSGCVKRVKKYPRAIGIRLICASRAWNCQSFRNCNKCANPSYCSPSKKKKVQKKPATARPATARPATARPTTKRNPAKSR